MEKDILTSLASHKDGATQQMCTRAYTEGSQPEGLGKGGIRRNSSRSEIQDSSSSFHSSCVHLWIKDDKHKVSMFKLRIL